MSIRFLSLCSIALLSAGCTPPTSQPQDPQQPEADEYTWDAAAISHNGSVILAAKDVPQRIQVSEDSVFRVSGDISSFAAGPSGDWFAFTIHGSAHDAGWVMNTQTDMLMPVAFQYGGGVKVRDWTSASVVTFTVTTAEPAENTITVDVTSPSAYPKIAGEDEEQGASSTSQGTAAGWQTYQNEEIGIALQYPDEMQVEEGAEGPHAVAGVHFTLWGDTQTQGTELFDGISVTIQRGVLENTLQQHAQAQVESAMQVGSIEQPLREASFAGVNGYAFTADTLGTHSHILIPVGQNEYLHVSYSHPDPNDQRYDDTVARMLNTVVVQ